MLLNKRLTKAGKRSGLTSDTLPDPVARGISRAKPVQRRRLYTQRVEARAQYFDGKAASKSTVEEVHVQVFD
jgi:hypothetical protein